MRREPDFRLTLPSTAGPKAPLVELTREQTSEEAEGSTLSRRAILAVCCLALFVPTMDNTVVNVALPTIQRDLSTSGSGLQWVVDSYVLVVASLLLTSGALGDRYGRRRVLQVGLAIFAAGSLTCSLAPTLSTLVIFRALQGVGGSMITPATLSILTSVYTDRRARAQAIGLWSATTGLSIGFGPVIGGTLVQALGWRSIFWINLPTVAFILLVGRRFIPESRARYPRRPDWRGQTLATAALALLTYSFIEAPNTGWMATSSLVRFALALALAIAFVAVERRRDDPLLDLSYFRSKSFSGAVIVAYVAFMCFFTFIFLNTLYLQEVRGYSALMAGVYTIPATGVVIFAAPLSGRLTGASGPRLPTTVSCLMIAAALGILTRISPAEPIWHLFPAYVLLGIGIGAVNPPITNAAVSGMPQDQAGVSSATASTARQLGGVFGVALIGSIVLTHFRDGLSASGIGLPDTGGGTSMDLTRLPPAIKTAADAAFTNAIHVGFAIAGVLVLLGALVAGIAMRSEQRRPLT